ncbi:response regulator transcription factor [Oscillatoria acuminata]|uniref:Response regulator containing a CheY-like receiver domain and an HTH DNA-binding domain n=1 Tax=Oscillatoria acuminata PCC 6304 TaxID=56110 RepID=K9TCS9_9CYAN|nr:response regulator transcription factor [Oscillatoria acuminata]AFY80325.1 response regulator containing a CheY-like receiver domain and an HTH DNA-binding domain [Oscillatoria acuminata PCC 6304]
MPLTILIVDDDPAIRLSICHYLEQCGYSAIAAQNGQEGLLKVEEFQPHLLVTDIIMPEMDGYELVKRVRKKPALRLLPVIFLTARTSTPERILGYKLGCDLYLPKPFDLEELGVVIRNLLERSQLIQSQRQFNADDSPYPPSEPNLNSPSSFDSLPASFNPGTPALTAQESEFAISLTPRERDVLDLLAEGLSNSQIGDRLHLSPRTVEKYVSALLRKTETSNRAGLLRFAIEHHLV